MKISLFLLFLMITLNAFSQDSDISSEAQIKNVINRFFESLETKDAELMRQTTMENAQIWSRYSDESPIRFNMRYIQEDLLEMNTLPNVKEVALDYEINEKNGIAIAWVPYEFWIEGEFSHCGTDVFTLFDIEGTWKIMSLAYSIEKENCNRFK